MTLPHKNVGVSDPEQANLIANSNGLRRIQMNQRAQHARADRSHQL
ncbi:hypothetical protein [uncultured Roseobacter sp.]|nr:hypothetical protein [uncultured Roseobacter sp.]